MNIFDVGGIVSTIALIFTLLIGTGIFIGINTIFECWYFGWRALIGEWLGCVIVAAFIVNFLSGIVFGIMVSNKISCSYWGIRKYSNIYLFKG